MPRPLHKRNFSNAANTSIKVTYHNGSTTVTGYVVKQLGSKKFRVTTDGTTTFDVTLAQNSTLAGTLTAGYCTITCAPHGGGTKYIMNVTSKKCVTTDGSVYTWQYTATDAAGQARINRNT